MNVQELIDKLQALNSPNSEVIGSFSLYDWNLGTYVLDERTVYDVELNSNREAVLS